MSALFLQGPHKIQDYLDAYDLDRSRPHLSPELHKPNDYYGHMHHLRQYAQENDAVDCTLEHGFGSPASMIWEVDQKAPFASHWVMSEQRVAKILARTPKWSIAIGPYLHYAPAALDEDNFAKEKKRLGRSLLVFPAHSTHFNRVQFDAQRFIGKIKEISQNYDTVRLCLYWADLDGSFAEICQSEGWEIVCAGHIYDTHFLPRLKSLLSLSEGIVYNTFGTQVAYAAMMNKAQFHVPLDWSLEINSKGRVIDKQEDYDQTIFQGMAEFSKLCGNLGAHSLERSVSQMHKRFCGLASLRSPVELKALFKLNRSIQRIANRQGAEFQALALQRLDFEEESCFELYREEILRQQLNQDYFQSFSAELKTYLNLELF